MEEANLQKRDSVAASSRLDGASGRNLRIGSSGKSNRKEHALREPAVHLLRLVTGSIGSPHRHQSVQWSFFFFPSSVESLTNQIIWGDKMTGNPHTWKEYYFSVYSFSLCNTALFGSHALAYPASISTSSRCLTVPMQIFDHIAGWIPLECPAVFRQIFLCTCSSLLSQVVGSHAAVSLLLFRIVSARSLTVAFAGRPVAGRRRSKIVREKL